MSKPNPELVVVGAIVGAHGVRGDVRVKSFTADPLALFDYAPFLDEDGAEILDPVGLRPAKDHFVVAPKVMRQKEEWDELKGTRLYVPRDRFPEPDEDEFYIDDLIGLEVFVGGDEKIGRVKAVLNHGAGDLIEVLRLEKGKPVLVPFTHKDVPVVDLKQGRIIVANFEIWQDETRPDENA